MKRGSRNLLSLALCLFLLIGALPLRAAADLSSTGIQIDGNTGDTSYSFEGGGAAAWRTNGKTLTFTGSCTIAVSGTGKDAVSIVGGNSSDIANVVVESGADVTLQTSGAGSSYPLFSYGGLNVMVKSGGSLTVENSAPRSSATSAIKSIGPLTIVVDAGGSLIARSMAGNQGEEAMGRALDGDGVSITNNGNLTAAGNVYGIYSASDTKPVTIGGSGVTLVAGGSWGIFSFSPTVTIENSTRGLVAGGIKAVDFDISMENPVFTNNAADTFRVMDGAPADLWGQLEHDPDFADHSTGLDLSGVATSACYVNKTSGLALWEYGLRGNSGSRLYNRLTLVGAEVSSGGLKLPAGDVEVDLQGDNAIAGISMAEGVSNVLTLQGDGLPGVKVVNIAPPQENCYATAVAGAGKSSAIGIPGSVYRAESWGEYVPQTADRYFQLAYHPEDDLGADEYLLTLKDSFGGGVYASGADVSLKFLGEAEEPFFGWGQFNPENGNTIAKFGTSSDREMTFQMPAKHTAIQAVRENPPPPPSPGPSLETGEHRNYLNGYPDGTIRPERNLTREETAMIFYNLLDDASRTRYETTDCPFPDVKEGWSYQAVCTLANAGILMGDPDGNFRPAGMVTRAEFAAIAARFAPGTYAGDDLFPDIAGHWARDSINYAAGKNWVRGYEDGTFRPNANITRAEAATLINNVLERVPETVDDLLSGRRIFPDNADETAWYYLALEEAANSHRFKRKALTGVYERWTVLG